MICEHLAGIINCGSYDLRDMGNHIQKVTFAHGQTKGKLPQIEHKCK